MYLYLALLILQITHISPNKSLQSRNLILNSMNRSTASDLTRSTSLLPNLTREPNLSTPNPSSNAGMNAATDILGLQDADDAINSALQTIQSTNVAVEAAVSAIATCKAEGVVDCQQLKKLYNKTQEYISIAANSFQKANANASNTVRISNKAKALLNAAESAASNKANAKFSQLAAQIAQNSVAQAKIAASAVAQAAAQCSIIVQIRCNECPASA
jgi:hypothetical protein